ncbi:MAG TPA: DUF6116 family protein [Wenzhouxiangella sp.]|nr:DUF6116 family protein [Wenzhouxiangella sp.]
MWIYRKFLGPIQRFLERRRFRTLFMILAGLFVANVFIPDPIPFIDEALMLVATVIVGSVGKRKKGAPGKSGESSSKE